jgi:hypothetical protein
MTEQEWDNSIKKGDKITMTLKNMFGDNFDVKCTLVKKPFHDGYITKGSSYTSFYSEKTQDKPCYVIIVRIYKHRLAVNVQLHKIVRLMKGWNELV